MEKVADVSNSMATRISYAMILLVNSIVSWLMLTPWAMKKLEHLTLDYMSITCEGKQCYGYVAVQRVNFGLGLFHFILAFLLLGVRSSKDGRAGLQNGYWGPKILIWIAFVVLTFFIPETFFAVWGRYCAFIGAMVFVLLGLILLVDLAHTYAEFCLEKIENNDSKGWRALLIGSTLSMYTMAFAMTIVMYIFFANSGCAMNQAAITVRVFAVSINKSLTVSQVNLILLLIISAISVHPTVQEFNPQAGLAQAGMVAIYCSYLTMSAVSMEPDEHHCNPLIRARGTRTATVVIGAIVTMVTIAYTTTRAATQGIALGSHTGHAYSKIGSEDAEHTMVDQQPSSARREMRAEALRAAVEAGSLPANALDDDDDDDASDDGHGGKDDERSGTQYNYSLFHVIFLLATCWVATLLTQNINLEEQGDFASVGRTFWASWVKIVSAWVCYGIYTWSLVAPVAMPDRFGY